MPRAGLRSTLANRPRLSALAAGLQPSVALHRAVCRTKPQDGLAATTKLETCREASLSRTPSVPF